MIRGILGVDAPWLPAVVPFLIASVVCAAAVPVSALLARRVGAVDEPDSERRIHATPTPRLGGIALAVGFAMALAVSGSAVADRWSIMAICLAVTAAMVADDILHMPWWAKLVVEIGAGLAVCVAGISITFFAVPGSVHPQLIQLGWWAVPITVIWLVGMQTSINFLDGSDGVAAGVVGIVAAICLLAAINRLDGAADVQNGVIVLSGAVMGCCTGFLIWNWPPARVFMGDTGSHFLGVAIGIITILGVAKIAVGLSLALPLIALGLPIGDTAAAIVRRRRAGTGITQPDAGHLHHRLLARGLSPTETALTFYLATAVLGCLGLFVFGHRRILVVALVLLLAGLGFIALRTRRRRVDQVEGYVMVEGRRTVPARTSHQGEADSSS